jgi:hypothetical protein
VDSRINALTPAECLLARQYCGGKCPAFNTIEGRFCCESLLPRALDTIDTLRAELDLLRRRWAHVERACTQYGQYTPVDVRDTARNFEHQGLLGLGTFLRGIAEAKGEK